MLYLIHDNRFRKMTKGAVNMCRIEQVSISELGKRQKVTVRHGEKRAQAVRFKNLKLIEYIIPLFKKGEKLWRLNR